MADETLQTNTEPGQVEPDEPHNTIIGFVVDRTLYHRQMDDLAQLRDANAQIAELGRDLLQQNESLTVELDKYKATTKERLVLTKDEAAAWPRFLRVMDTARREHLSHEEGVQLAALVTRIESAVVLPTPMPKKNASKK